jgi:hypothetical protein
MGPVYEVIMDTSQDPLSLAVEQLTREAAGDQWALIDSAAKSLRDFGDLLLVDARQRIVASMLAAVGRTVEVPDLDIDVKRKSLVDALQQVVDLLTPVEAPEVFDTEDIALGPDTSSEAPPIREVVRPPPDPREGWWRTEYQRLTAEVGDLDIEELVDTPLARKEPLVQALVAEVRYLLEDIPPAHHLHWQVSQLIPQLTRVKGASGITPFVNGLSRRAHGNWRRISAEARERVRRYDRDVEASESLYAAEAPKSSPKHDRPEPEPEPETEPESGPLQLDSWPKMRALLTKPMVLIGGTPMADKVQTILKRFGLGVEWLGIEGSGLRLVDGYVHQIENHSYGVVILLEGLSGHKQMNLLADACKTSGTKWAYGHRAGVGYLAQCFDQIEASIVEP